MHHFKFSFFKAKFSNRNLVVLVKSYSKNDTKTFERSHSFQSMNVQCGHIERGFFLNPGLGKTDKQTN